jgi:hypothetical protein
MELHPVMQPWIRIAFGRLKEALLRSYDRGVYVRRLGLRFEMAHGGVLISATYTLSGPSHQNDGGKVGLLASGKSLRLLEVQGASGSDSNPRTKGMAGFLVEVNRGAGWEGRTFKLLLHWATSPESAVSIFPLDLPYVLSDANDSRTIESPILTVEPLIDQGEVLGLCHRRDKSQDLLLCALLMNPTLISQRNGTQIFATEQWMRQATATESTADIVWDLYNELSDVFGMAVQTPIAILTEQEFQRSVKSFGGGVLQINPLEYGTATFESKLPRLATELGSCWWGAGVRPRGSMSNELMRGVTTAAALVALDRLGYGQAVSGSLAYVQRANGQWLRDQWRTSQGLSARGVESRIITVLYGRLNNEAGVEVLRDLTARYWGLQPRAADILSELGVHI